MFECPLACHKECGVKTCNKKSKHTPKMYWESVKTMNINEREQVFEHEQRVMARARNGVQLTTDLPYICGETAG